MRKDLDYLNVYFKIDKEKYTKVKQKYQPRKEKFKKILEEKIEEFLDQELKEKK